MDNLILMLLLGCGVLALALGIGLLYKTWRKPAQTRSGNSIPAYPYLDFTRVFPWV